MVQMEGNKCYDSTIAGYNVIELCRKLRTAVKQGKVFVDVKHQSTEALTFLDMDDLDIKQFLIQYIFDIQPCTLELVHYLKTSKATKVIEIETLYKCNLYIRFVHSGRCFVSLQNDNVTPNMICREVSLNAIQNKFSYMLLNKPIEQIQAEHYYRIYMSWGFSTVKVDCLGNLCAEDLICVDMRDFNEKFEIQMLSFLRILKQFHNTEYEIRGRFEDGGKSFEKCYISYGLSNIAKMSLLVESYAFLVDVYLKLDALTVIGYFIDELMFFEDKLPLYESLKERYGDYKNVALDLAYKLLSRQSR